MREKGTNEEEHGVMCCETDDNDAERAREPSSDAKCVREAKDACTDDRDYNVSERLNSRSPVSRGRRIYQRDRCIVVSRHVIDRHRLVLSLLTDQMETCELLSPPLL